MKKIIIILSCFLLTGCFENSGYIVKSCYKEEKSNDLKVTTTYTFKFKNDIIDDLNITYDNIGNSNSISSVKLSIESQNKYTNLEYNVLIDNETEYKIEYIVPLDSDKEVLDKLNVKQSRTDFVNNLKSLGYTCE
ncbi:MAG TPA: hypothetical protein IAC20_02440 [Candidatus Faecisoma merdavium]|nr:hypothetical protein [Candidatus Faecisoma merdavium]